MSPNMRVIVARDVREYLDRMSHTGQSVRGCWIDLAGWMEDGQ